MRAVVKEADGKENWAIKEVERRDPKDNEVEIQIQAAGICGSELHLYHDNHHYRPGNVIGHEFSGIITRVGKDVKGWNVGDRVVSENHITSCGVCEYCRNGFRSLCKERIAVGYGINGGWTNYICMPTHLMIKLPDSVTYEMAAMVEPLSVTIDPICVTNPIMPGDTVLVQGCGTIGLMAAMVAKAAGAGRVIVTGIEVDEPVRLKTARELDIDYVVNVERESLADLVNELTNNNGVDYIIEASGSGAAIDTSLELVKRNGRIVAIGEVFGNNVNFRWNTAIFRGCNLKFSYSSNYWAWRRAVEYMASGKVDVTKLITHRISMEDFRTGFEMMEKKEALKVIMSPFEEK